MLLPGRTHFAGQTTQRPGPNATLRHTFVWGVLVSPTPEGARVD